jgi:hypothetical protein
LLTPTIKSDTARAASIKRAIKYISMNILHFV